MSEKTLVEQLREFIKEQIGTGFYLANELTKFADHIEAKYTPNSEIAEKYTPYPLDADGNTCRLGDFTDHGKIQSMTLCEGYLWLIMVENGEETENGDPVTEPWCPEHLHHVEPPKQLTKENIDAKAKAGWAIDYWDCRGTSCVNCPSRIDGKIPREYYEVRTCEAAMLPDILRLERDRVAGEQS